MQEKKTLVSPADDRILIRKKKWQRSNLTIASLRASADEGHSSLTAHVQAQAERTTIKSTKFKRKTTTYKTVANTTGLHSDWLRQKTMLHAC